MMTRQLIRIPVCCILLAAVHLGTVYCEQAGSASSEPKPVAVKDITVSKARKIATVRPDRLLFPVALCWSPDDSTLFIAGQKVEKKRELIVTSVIGNYDRWDINYQDVGDYFALDPANGEVRKIEKEPDWVKGYWAYKSAAVSRDGSEIRQGVSNQPGQVYRLAGVIIGRTRDVFRRFELRERESTILFPGMTYSWAPPGGKAIVFEDDFKVYIMSEDGKEKRKIASGDYSLPAWSNDGRKIALIKSTPLRDAQSTSYWEVYLIELSQPRHPAR